MRYGIILVGAAVLVGCKKEAPKAPPPEVLVTPVAQQDVPVGIEAVGQTKGSEEVEIRPRVSGYLKSVNFKEGQPIKKGDLLYEIDPQPFEAAVSQAKGQLGQAQAALAKANADVARYRPLVEQKAVSKQELDNALAAQQNGEASVEAAKGAMQEAQVNLSYCRISSPTDGIAGINAVSVGNLVGPNNQAALTTVSKVDPIRVPVAVSEKDYLELQRRSAERRAKGDTTRRPIELVLADGSVHPYPGPIRAMQSRVDPTTGTMTVEVEFPNPEKILRAGQFARIRAVSDVLHGALVVPQRAIEDLQGIKRVYVVGAGDSVQVRTVTLGPVSGNLQVVQSGVQAGDRVIVEGIQRVRPGVVVVPKPAPAAGDTTHAPTAPGATPAAADTTHKAVTP